ncbi:hypothetical protein [Falsirhodobacter xinxiangensis]|uniref:hypothetical protein n=1 Tax=Falsirhodobacter xinxiangensis TaxID=2530049 RepID=UPI0010AA4036|nr:hypothetical protein [Rhodobacter xinxiangensis]
MSKHSTFDIELALHIKASGQFAAPTALGAELPAPVFDKGMSAAQQLQVVTEALAPVAATGAALSAIGARSEIQLPGGSTRSKKAPVAGGSDEPPEWDIFGLPEVVSDHGPAFSSAFLLSSEFDDWDGVDAHLEFQAALQDFASRRPHGEDDDTAQPSAHHVLRIASKKL